MRSRIALPPVGDQACIDGARHGQDLEEAQDPQPDGGTPSHWCFGIAPAGDDQDHRGQGSQRHGEGRSDGPREEPDLLEGFVQEHGGDEHGPPEPHRGIIERLSHEADDRVLPVVRQEPEAAKQDREHDESQFDQADG